MIPLFLRLAFCVQSKLLTPGDKSLGIHSFALNSFVFVCFLERRYSVC